MHDRIVTVVPSLPHSAYNLEMNDDQPSIAILGAGPIGIEAALYARYLGFAVQVFEQGTLCHHVRNWGHVQMFSPFGMNSSSLGRSALAAQNPTLQLPADDQCHTGHDWIDCYLKPLAESDLIQPCLRTRVTVRGVGRDTTQINSDTPRAEAPFRLLLDDSAGNERIETADVVIDTTGTWGQANPLGLGGMPAIGERCFQSDGQPQPEGFHRRIPDWSRTPLAAGSRIAVFGSGFSAATNILQLKRKRQEDPNLHVVWCTRSAAGSPGPLLETEQDPLPGRLALARTINGETQENRWLDWRPGVEVVAIRQAEGEFHLQLSDGTRLTADQVISNTGYCGDFDFLSALNVHRCYESGGPMAWAASVAASSPDCLQQKSAGPTAVRTTEPNFFIIGCKSYGKDPRFLFATGLQQIRDVFKIIAERETLDVYASLPAHALSG